MTIIQRKGIDMDPVKPWQWATLPGRNSPVEIVSYPIPAQGRSEIDREATIMVRMTVGDPTSIREVPFRTVACFDPSRHEWHYRPKRYYGDNPTAFVFDDERERLEALLRSAVDVAERAQANAVKLLEQRDAALEASMSLAERCSNLKRAASAAVGREINAMRLVAVMVCRLAEVAWLLNLIDRVRALRARVVQLGNSAKRRLTQSGRRNPS